MPVEIISCGEGRGFLEMKAYDASHRGQRTSGNLVLSPPGSAARGNERRKGQAARLSIVGGILFRPSYGVVWTDGEAGAEAVFTFSGLWRRGFRRDFRVFGRVRRGLRGLKADRLFTFWTNPPLRGPRDAFPGVFHRIFRVFPNSVRFSRSFGPPDPPSRG